jgi:YidC/Oxa1 family membrane protein insertase
VPQDQNSLSAKWVAEKSAVSYDPDRIANSDDENIGIELQTGTITIAPAAEHTCSFQLYLGPKDRNLFNSVPLYKSLGFIKVIDFQACFGDTFSSLSFFILATMAWLYRFIPNYGIVIIIFVFVVRILLHPITKKSQVSMMKMSKLAPKSEEIKKKYADNKAEMNKQMMVLYKEHGASPVLGCLPMLLQMPIWIALYSAIYAGIEFRGAKFLPFWITDLSSVDAHSARCCNVRTAKTYAFFSPFNKSAGRPAAENDDVDDAHNDAAVSLQSTVRSESLHNVEHSRGTC